MLEVLDGVPVGARIRAPIDQARIITRAVRAMLFEDCARPTVRASVHAREQSVYRALCAERETRKTDRQLRFENAGHGCDALLDVLR